MRASITFFFDITVFLYQNKNPVDHTIHAVTETILCFPDLCYSLTQAHRSIGYRNIIHQPLTESTV
jgi:hypothetical protein